MKIVSGSSSSEVCFQLKPGETLGSCAKEIAAKMGHPEKWMSVLQDLVKTHGFDGINDPRLSRLASSEDANPATFHIPDYAASAYAAAERPAADLARVVQPEAQGVATLRRGEFWKSAPVEARQSREVPDGAELPADLKAFADDAETYVSARVEDAIAEVEEFYAAGFTPEELLSEGCEAQLSEDACRLLQIASGDGSCEDLDAAGSALADEMYSAMELALSEAAEVAPGVVVVDDAGIEIEEADTGGRAVAEGVYDSGAEPLASASGGDDDFGIVSPDPFAEDAAPEDLEPDGDWDFDVTYGDE